MVNQDLIYGIKNAIDRGESAEQAKISFINAGYNYAEVEEAAKGLTPDNSVLFNTAMPEMPMLQDDVKATIFNGGVRKSSKMKWIIISLASLLGLLIFAIVYFIFIF